MLGLSCCAVVYMVAMKATYTRQSCTVRYPIQVACKVDSDFNKLAVELERRKELVKETEEK
jgi:hypothetical protein